ncbi:unnamed protein product [Calicophoron daubneyi]|uniref:Uncharacterized protein n=1 Tax=Calicophoron daubneyi TaxID=300641 RepID=A0AAV2TY77_CALDB
MLRPCPWTGMYGISRKEVELPPASSSSGTNNFTGNSCQFQVFVGDCTGSRDVGSLMKNELHGDGFRSQSFRIVGDHARLCSVYWRPKKALIATLNPDYSQKKQIEPPGVLDCRGSREISKNGWNTLLTG